MSAGQDAEASAVAALTAAVSPAAGSTAAPLPAADDAPSPVVPAALASLDGVAPGALPAGAPGKDGRLILEFVSSGGAGAAQEGAASAGGAVPGGRTAVARRFARTPLHLTRTLTPDRAFPGMAASYVQSTGGGLVQGDRCRVDVTCRSGAHALVTTQAATKSQRMDRGYALNDAHLAVDAGAVLEYLPDPVICHGGTRLHQNLEARVVAGGRLIASDCIVSGRLARGEAHAYDLVTSITRVEYDGRPLALDRLTLEPGSGADPVLAAGSDALGSLVAVTGDASVTREVVAAMRAVDVPGVRIGASSLHGGLGAWARVLGSGGVEPATRALHALWDAARRAMLGAPAFDLRKM